MKEFAGRMVSVNLDGEDGCAEIDVRILVPVSSARKLSRWMLESGSPLRVLIPTENGSPRRERERLQTQRSTGSPALPSDYPVRVGILKAIGERMGRADAWLTKCLRDEAVARNVA